MDARDSFAWLVSLLAIFFYFVVCGIVSNTPQEVTGYELKLYNLSEGESFVVTALSPSVESAEINITAESTRMFLFTGTEEILADEVDDKFTREVQTTLGEWQAIEADMVDVVIQSKDAIMVTADRGFQYHFFTYFILFMVLLLLWFLWMVLIYD